MDESTIQAYFEVEKRIGQGPAARAFNDQGAGQMIEKVLSTYDLIDMADYENDTLPGLSWRSRI